MYQLLVRPSNLFILILIGGIAWLQPSYAQDIQFSDFNRTPLQVNAAQTGNFEGKIRALAGYRNQWSQVLRGDAFNAYFASIDARILGNKKQALSIGLSGLTDVAEISIGSNAIHFSTTYERKLISTQKANHSLRVGIEAGINEFSLSRRRAIAQVDLEFIEIDNNFLGFTFFDVNGGLVWQSTYANGNAFHIGVAANHLNRASIIFMGQDESHINVRYTIHGSGEFQVSSTWKLLPSFFYVNQGSHSAVTAGASGRKYLGNQLSGKFLQGGLLIRRILGNGFSAQSSAIIPVMNLNLNRFSIGLSYDFVTSSLMQQGSSGGAAELTLGYIY